MTKFIFITGGVISSLGKGIASSVLGALLQARGYTVKLRKLDPYLNIDPGTMNPTQHGEVFVTDDGGETDLDLGHYERFAGVSARKGDNITSGRIFKTLLEAERRGDYLGSTVQVIPHVTDLIKGFILHDTDEVDFVITEIGGTVGDIEALPYLESVRQIGYELGKQRVLYIHVTFIPYIVTSMELKTKPTQHSVKELCAIGIQPDIVMCRADRNLTKETRQKIGLFCNLKHENVIQALDQATIYHIPIAYHSEGLDGQVLAHFGLDASQEPDMQPWHDIALKIQNLKEVVRIAIVAKYMQSQDAYKSLVEALNHAAIYHQHKLEIIWIDAEEVNEASVRDKLQEADGVLVPGGFGIRGVEGKIATIKYARENNKVFLGICLGMQLATIEFARNVVGIADAHSTEFSNTSSNIVGLMTEWTKDKKSEKRDTSSEIGGSMRLGAFDCNLKEGSLVRSIYGEPVISERHRHRYELNPAYRPALQQAGMVVSGIAVDNDLAEIIELPASKWFLGVQFHPEFKSRPFAPHPLFVSFIENSIR